MTTEVDCSSMSHPAAMIDAMLVSEAGHHHDSSPDSRTSPVKSNNNNGNSSSSSLHRVADKLKEKLNQQMNEPAPTEQPANEAKSNADQSSPSESKQQMTSQQMTSQQMTSQQKAQQKSTSESSRSQYHSIQQLSSPSAKATGGAISAASGSSSSSGFCSQPGGQLPYKYSNPRFYLHNPTADAYQANMADTFDVLRGMMKEAETALPGGADAGFGNPCSSGSGGGLAAADRLMMMEFRNRKFLEQSAAAIYASDNQYNFLNNSEEEDGEEDGDMDDDGGASFRSDTVGESVSVDDMSDQGEMSETERDNGGAGCRMEGDPMNGDNFEDEKPHRSTAEDSRCSGDEVVNNGEKLEAKKARVENIISNMRLSPSSRIGSGNNCGSVGEKTNNYESRDKTRDHDTAGGYQDQPVEMRRPKRKQYIPQQHDAKDEEEDRAAGMDEPLAKMICKRDEKDYMQMELLQMQRQLAEMQHKYLQMYEQGFDCGGSEAALDLNSKRFADKLAAGIFSDVNRNEIQQQSSSSEVGFPYSSSSRQLIEKAAKKIESMHTDADKPANLEHLTRLLKAEISSSIGSLVDGVVKTFVAKYFNNLKEEGQSDGHQSKARKSNHEQQMKEEPMPGTSKPAVAPPVPLIRPPLPQSLLAPPPIHHPFQERNNNIEMSKQHQQHREKMLDKYIHPYFDLHGKRAFDIPQAHLPLFAPHAYYPPTMAKFQPLFVKEPEQTEALPLVVTTPKKKRTKVTDTRLSPRAARAMLQESLSHHHHHHHQQQQQQHHQHHQQPPPSEHGHRGGMDASGKPAFHPHHHHHYQSAMGAIHEAFPHPAMLPVGLPTSVAIHNPSLQHSDLFQAMYSQTTALVLRDNNAVPMQHQQQQQLQQSSSSKRPSSNSSDIPNSPNSLLKCDSDGYDQMMSDSLMSFDGHNLTSTLTPMHLRKAKLMFFYVRYPSSAILKIYFPDVKFNKNNTAQLVKWFSNFREFYYIQMEKYARQALAEGVKNVTDLVITTDSELYRILVLHYNRNNQIEVPENFRFVVQATLREFFISIAAEKDQEQSWKKSIYKIIARMDDAVPEYFKSPNWMEQLADG